MFCPNCKGKLEVVDTEKLLSQDLMGGDYYTHQCPSCNTYWHLHVHSGNVDLISTDTKQFIASKKITKDLKTELENRVAQLSLEG